MIRKLALLMCLIVVNNANASLDVSLEPRCFGDPSNTFYFSNTTLTADYNVNVGASVFPYDIAFEIVDSAIEADLVFIEHSFGGINSSRTRQFSNNSDIKICSKLSPVGATAIKLSTNEQEPDVTVKISNYVLNKDYKIYIESERVSARKAASYFAVLWLTERESFLALLE